MLKHKKITADFCVVGGGMAGICAAVAAARGGASVVLMHERPVLGGNASSEIRMWICGAQGSNNRETGILEEIALENYYRNPTKNYYIWDTVLYDFVKREKNITLLLNCTCMDAETVRGSFDFGRNTRIDKITGYQMTTQTFFDVYAQNYSDCSGDSILAPLTGAEYRIGRESAEEFGEDTHVKAADKNTMGMSCLLTGRETTKPVKFTPPEWHTQLAAGDFAHRTPYIHSSSENFWYLELGGDRDSIGDTEEIAAELVPLAIGTWDYIKNSGDCNADNWELDFLGFLPGKRESRRMVGEYMITERDIVGNRHFDDTVAFGGWPLDDHFPGGFYHKGTPNTNIQTPPAYHIPYRILYSKNVSNLFFAGRNVSMTHMAMSSIRVMATCGIMGQAVGTAAAMCAEYHISPHEIYVNKIDELRSRLAACDCFIPGYKRKIGALCLATPIINGSDALKTGADRPHLSYSLDKIGVSVPNGTVLVYRFASPEYIRTLHVTFDSDLNRTTLLGDECERTHTMRANVRLDSPVFYVPKTLCKSFCIEITTPTGTRTLYKTEKNLNRAYEIAVNDEVLSLSLAPAENWGGSECTTVFSFDFA